MLPTYVTEAFAKGECAIGRCWGQTLFYVPISIAQQVGEEKILQLAAKIFTQKKLDEFKTRTYRDQEHYLLELPSVLKFPGPDHPEYNLPDKLAELIMALAKLD